MTVPWDAATAAAIGADWLLAAIAPASAFGRAARTRERPFVRGDETAARTAIARVAWVARSVPAPTIAELRSKIAAAPNLFDTFGRARGGATLDDADFFELGRLGDALADVARLSTSEALGETSLAFDCGLRVALAPGRTPARTFYLDDSFSDELLAARGELGRAQRAFDGARGRTLARIAATLGRETVGEPLVLMRDALPNPLPLGLRIVREAPSYVLCEIELDDISRAALEARDLALEVLAEAEEKVRRFLSREVARAASSLERACESLGALDLLLARASFAQSHACVAPHIVENAEVSFDDVRFLPLVEALAVAGRAYRPLSFDLAGMGLVTGSNMGGKTAALRALGFAVACVTFGVPVPARAATLPLVDEISWLGLGALPAEDSLLSAFGREIVDLQAFLERAAPRPLVLLDEFARTTSPREGRALLLALLETLASRDAFGFAATHFDEVAAQARVPHFMLGVRDLPQLPKERLELDVALAHIAALTDYRLTRASVGDVARPGDALALAGALGLDPALLASARRFEETSSRGRPCS